MGLTRNVSHRYTHPACKPRNTTCPSFIPLTPQLKFRNHTTSKTHEIKNARHVVHTACHKFDYLKFSLIALCDIFRLKAPCFFPPLPLQLKLAGSQPAHINTYKFTPIQRATSTRERAHTLLKSCRKAEEDHIMQIAATCQDVPGIRTQMEKRGLSKGAKKWQSEREAKQKQW